ncbi:transposable element Tc3 transposase [Trichonephila clavipes]|nr:transposable element Tc3 transposase [Trichonephila clavipes]
MQMQALTDDNLPDDGPYQAQSQVPDLGDSPKTGSSGDGYFLREGEDDYRSFAHKRALTRWEDPASRTWENKVLERASTKISSAEFGGQGHSHNDTVNGDRYRAMITNFFIPELNNYDVQELWFHQDGATCHTARATVDLLKDTFGDRLISRFGPVNCPPRSCDLTPLDYFLWGHVKSLVYADKPQTFDHLEDNICRVIADIRPQMLGKDHRKLDIQIGLHPSQPWQSYARNHI